MDKSQDLPFPWQLAQWKYLCKTHKIGRLPHAVLFIGQKGLGKALFAVHLAKALLCKRALGTEDLIACRQCRDCYLVAANTHPDLLCLSAETPQKNIKIDQIRYAIERLNQTTQASYKIIILKSADSLLPSASNALLKSLEEPPGPSLFILTTDKPALLLPTLRSRCQTIRFSLPERLLAESWLKKQLPEWIEVDRLYYLAEGSPLQALDYAKNGSYLFYENLLVSLVHLLKRETDPIKLAENYLKADYSLLLHSLFKIINKVLKSQLCKLTLNRENQTSVRFLVESLDSDFLLYYFDYLLMLQRRNMQTNLNRQLLLEVLFFPWSVREKVC